MKTSVRIKFGSHLYGTATPASDLDFKSVFVPSGRDILLQRVKGSITTKRAKLPFEKNLPGEIDEEAYSLQRYLGLVAEGQTVAMDVLFAPEWAMTDEPTWEWKEIIDNRDRLVTRKAAAFIGYCRQQANKYGIKGSRVAAARAAMSLLGGRLAKPCPSPERLLVLADEIKELVDRTEHMAILDIEGATDVNGVKRTVRHWEVCGRKMPYTLALGSAYFTMKRLVDEYGQRALQAEKNEGVDWKALSHAVRVGRQAIELLGTGEVTFPRPEAAHLLAIKTGQLGYEAVAAEIEGLLIEVEQAAAESQLPEAPDQVWIDRFVAAVYRDAVLADA